MECIANIRARYDGEKANPYNEAEYGRHYARAMASWGAIPMLSGFLYNAPARELVIKPLIHVPNFACFWSTPTGWGNFQITSEKAHPVLHLTPIRGFLELHQLNLTAKDSSQLALRNYRSAINPFRARLRYEERMFFLHARKASVSLPKLRLLCRSSRLRRRPATQSVCITRQPAVTHLLGLCIPPRNSSLLSIGADWCMLTQNFGGTC